MSITCTCSCGATYRVTDAAAGRRARCHRCGAEFRVPTTDEPDDDGQIFSLAADALPSDAMPIAAPGEFHSTLRPVPPTAYAEEEDFEASRPRTFLENVAMSFLAPFLGPNLPVLVFVCIAMFLANGGFFMLGSGGIVMLGGAILTGLSAGWLCAFWFNTVLDTAQGEDYLPSVRVTNLFDDLLIPLFRFVGCIVLVLVPALVAAIIMTTVAPPVSETLVRTLVGIGLFFLPVTLLMTAIGGALPVTRPHLVVYTVARTFLPYVGVTLVCAIPVLAMVGLDHLVSLWLARGATAPSVKIQLVTQVGGRLFAAYTSIVAMRLIGVYYLHCKSRFPWAAE